MKVKEGSLMYKRRKNKQLKIKDYEYRNNRRKNISNS